jgi:hypothetical protein
MEYEPLDKTLFEYKFSDKPLGPLAEVYPTRFNPNDFMKSTEYFHRWLRDNHDELSIIEKPFLAKYLSFFIAMVMKQQPGPMWRYYRQALVVIMKK